MLLQMVLEAEDLLMMKKEKGSKTVAVSLFVLVVVFLLDVTITIFRSCVIYPTRPKGHKLGHGNGSTQQHSRPIACGRFDYYDICHLNGPTILDPKTATLYVAEEVEAEAAAKWTPPTLEKIRPYPHKFQYSIMSHIRELTVTTAPPPPDASCAVAHSTPALLFSAGGYTGNFFHDLSDGFIPLFITVHSHFPSQDVILAVHNCSQWWLRKYADLLPHFTRHPILNLDREATAHCFPSAIVGLISHGPITVDPRSLPGPHPKTIFDFRALFAAVYGHDQPQKAQAQAQPRLVLVNRKATRRLLNVDQVRRAASEMGFEVAVFEPTLDTPMQESFRLLDSSHGMLGVHGAGLTHALFLRPGAVFVQVVPIGLSWLAHNCYKRIGTGLGLHYIEYETAVHESSLEGMYPRDSLELKNPRAIVNGNFSRMHPYMNQDVKLDLLRFERYLYRAYEKATKFMAREHLSRERSSKTMTF